MTAEGLQKKQVTLQAGVYVSTPSGNSMRPMLRGEKDSIVVKAVSGPVRRGDVLLYELPDGHHVLHRVIKVKSEGYKMRGDNSFIPEPILTDDLVIGILVGFWRGKRYYDCEKSVLYRLYVGFWMATSPFRRVYLGVKNRCKRICGK